MEVAAARAPGVQCVRRQRRTPGAGTACRGQDRHRVRSTRSGCRHPRACRSSRPTAKRDTTRRDRRKPRTASGATGRRDAAPVGTAVRSAIVIRSGQERPPRRSTCHVAVPPLLRLGFAAGTSHRTAMRPPTDRSPGRSTIPAFRGSPGPDRADAIRRGLPGRQPSGRPAPRPVVDDRPWPGHSPASCDVVPEARHRGPGIRAPDRHQRGQACARPCRIASRPSSSFHTADVTGTPGDLPAAASRHRPRRAIAGIRPAL